ncbi:hypothetical protein ACP4OV_018039 [Aristida adscensionis]
MPALATDMDSTANGEVESAAESPAPQAAADAEGHDASSPVAAAAGKGRGLRRWRRIRREQQRESHAAAAAAGGGGGGRAGDEDSAQLHKRRLPLPAGAAPKGRHDAALVEEEGSAASAASVESRFVPPAKLEPGGLGFLVAPAGFSVGAGGADSDNGDDRSSRSSTATSAPRAFPRHDAKPFPRPRAAGASLHGKSTRGARSRAGKAAACAAASTEAENSRSSVESDLRSSNAMNGRPLGGGAAGNGVRKVLSGHRDRSDGVRSTAGGCYKDDGSSVEGRLVQRSADSGDDVDDTLNDGNVGEGGNGGVHPDADPYAESALLLQRAQDALENEIQNFAAIGNVSNDGFDVHDDELSGSVHLEEPIDKASERIKHLESRLETASALIKEKDSRICELETLNCMQPGKTSLESPDESLSRFKLDQLFQESMEAEIQLILLTSSYHTWATLADDQMVLHEAQKSLSQDYKQLENKLRDTENRAMMLQEMAEKLQVQCKELSRSSEILQLQSKAGRVSLACFVQFILLCFAIGIYLMRLVPTSSEVVPT